MGKLTDRHSTTCQTRRMDKSNITSQEIESLLRLLAEFKRGQLKLIMYELREAERRAEEHGVVPKQVHGVVNMYSILGLLIQYHASTARNCLEQDIFAQPTKVLNAEKTRHCLQVRVGPGSGERGPHRSREGAYVPLPRPFLYLHGTRVVQTFLRATCT